MQIFDLYVGNTGNVTVNSDIQKSWRLSHKENGTSFSSIKCMVGEREYYISTSKKLQEELDTESNVSLSNMQLVPLYKNCLVDLNKDSKYETALVKVTTAASEIATVKLNGCLVITPFITDGGIGSPVSSIAFGVSIQNKNDYDIRLYRLDGTMISINSNDITTQKVKHIIKKPKRIQAPKIIIVPRKSYIVNDLSEEKEGYVSVHIYDIISKLSKIIENSKEGEYLVSPNVPKELVDQARPLLKYKIS